MRIATIFLSVLIFLYSCATMPVNLNPRVDYTSLSKKSEITTEMIPIYLHFEQEPMNFEYSKIGVLELTGTHADSIVYQNFRYQAWAKGGNAVLGIKKERIATGRSTTTETASGNSTTSTVFTNRWTGIIAELPTSVYESKKSELQQTNYVAFVESNEIAGTNANSPKLFGLVLLGFSAGFLWLLSASQGDG